MVPIVIMSKRLYVATIVILILVLFNVVFILNTANHDNGASTLAENIKTLDTQAFIMPVSEISYRPILDTNIHTPDINAKAAIVYDVNSSRYLYSKGIEEKLPVASLTKVLTAIITVEKLNFQDIVTIPKEAVRVDGERQDLYLGEQITIGDLLKMMLIKSSNDAAYALAFYGNTRGIDYIAEMNAKATNFGMDSSHFKDVAGLNDEAYSSAQDMVKLVKQALNYPILWTIMSQQTVDIKSVNGINHHVETTNQLFNQISGIVGGKTGFTDDAMGCMILVVEVPGENDMIISIVLGSNERFIDTKKLIDWTRQAYKW